MLFIFLRHAHRDTSNRDLDNGLSKKGEEQAYRLGQYLQLRSQKEPLLIGSQSHWFSSPKRRCIETISTLSNISANLPHFKIDHRLDEQQEKESKSEFRQRISMTLEESASRGYQAVFYCSHGDWISVATKLLGSGSISIRKGSWIEFEISEENGDLKGKLQACIPEFFP